MLAWHHSVGDGTSPWGSWHRNPSREGLHLTNETFSWSFSSRSLESEGKRYGMMGLLLLRPRIVSFQHSMYLENKHGFAGQSYT